MSMWEHLPQIAMAFTLWQGSTTDHSEARRWRDEHIHGTSGVDIIGEDVDED